MRHRLLDNADEREVYYWEEDCPTYVYVSLHQMQAKSEFA